MDIVFNVDDNYVRHMCVTILSIIDNNNEEDINFHVIAYELSADNKEYIKNLVSDKEKHVFFYKFDLEKMKHFSIGKGTGNPNISYATYLRLFIQDLLPKTINKVLYLDCDIVVINSIKDLWDKDIHNYVLAAKEDYGLAQIHGAKRMRLSEDYKYFNAGVLLLNLEALRKMRFTEMVMKFFEENKEIIKMHDQDILNGLLYKERLPIEEKWNMMCNTDNTKDYSIIHFAGLKPWYIECPHPLKYIYKEYLSQTKWKDIKDTHAFTTWQRFKRIVKSWMCIK